MNKKSDPEGTCLCCLPCGLSCVGLVCVCVSYIMLSSSKKIKGRKQKKKKKNVPENNKPFERQNALLCFGLLVASMCGNVWQCWWSKAHGPSAD